MPALPPVSKVIRVDLFGVVGSDTRVRDRIFFAFAGAGPTVADLNTLTLTIGNAWNTNIAPLCGTITLLFAVGITDLTSSTGNQVVVVQSHAGTRAGSNMTAAICAIIKFKIGRRYRGGHPRLYQSCGVVADLATPQTWTGAFVTAVTNGFSAFITACELNPPASVGALTHVNVSYFNGFHNVTLPSGRTKSVPTLRATPLQDTVIGYNTNGTLGSQRRRNLQSP